MPEGQLANKQTALVRGVTDAKMGHAVLTTERVVFFRQALTEHHGRRIVEAGPDAWRTEPA